MMAIGPVCPAARRCAAVRRPASEAPTTAMCAVISAVPQPVLYRPSVLDEDGLDGADVGRLLDLLAQGVVGVGLVDELALLVHLEDRRSGDGALAVVLAEGHVDGDLHCLFLSTRRAGAVQDPGVKPMGSRTGPVLPESGSHSAPSRMRGSRRRLASSGSASDMSVRATKCPRQWCAPPPKPKWGGRWAVMSNDGSPNTRGSVPADSLNRWIVVPALISRSWKVKSSTASRVTQRTVG